MYKGPYAFEFIGAVVRWSFLMIFFKSKRKEKNLFKKMMSYDKGIEERTANKYFINLVIGFLTVVVIVMLILKLML